MTYIEEIAYLARKGDAAAIDSLLSEMVLASDYAESIMRGRAYRDRETGRQPPLPPATEDPLEELRRLNQGYVHNSPHNAAASRRKKGRRR